MAAKIPFNRPALAGPELDYIRQAVELGHLSGDGQFTRRCSALLESRTGSARALLTHSCTAALEMGALLADIGPGDEVIMPSFTFVSTANAFVLRGATPVFVDIRSDTLNVDDAIIEQAVTPASRAIVPVHYAGVPCEMDAIAEVATSRQLPLVEDAAQALGSRYRGRPAGSFGSLAAVSFHETKNVVSGEGGALLVNDPRFAERAAIVREKGTDRTRFLRGEVDKYTWVDVGSSFLPSELTAAFLYAQMHEADEITERRRQVWSWYYERFEAIEARHGVKRPTVPKACEHNAHLFYVLVRDLETRTHLLSYLNANDVNAVFHYVPLHSSAAGRRYGRVAGSMANTDAVSERLIRLPLWVGMNQDDVDRVGTLVERALGK